MLPQAALPLGKPLVLDAEPWKRLLDDDAFVFPGDGQNDVRDAAAQLLDADRIAVRQHLPRLQVRPHARGREQLWLVRLSGLMTQRSRSWASSRASPPSRRTLAASSASSS